MKSIMKYLKKYRKESILAPLFKMLEAVFELCVPLVMAQIIDVGIVRSDKSFIVMMCIVLVSLAIIGLGSSISAQFFAAKAAVGFASGLRHALFSHIQRLSFSELDTVGNSTLITRMTSDVNQVQSGVNMVLRLFLRSPFIVFGAMVMAFTIDTESAIIFAIAIPVLSVIIFGIMFITMPMYKKVQAGLDKVLGITRENLSGARVIRAFNKEEEELIRFEDHNEYLTNMQKFVGRISTLMNPITYLVINMCIIALIWTGAFRVDLGLLTQGQVVALVSYMSQILIELIKLANLIITVTKALACAKRIEGVFLLETGMEDSRNVNIRNIDAGGKHTSDKDSGGMETSHKDTDNINNSVMNRKDWDIRTEGSEDIVGTESHIIVEFKNVSLRYKNAGDASLTDIDFRVKRGETIGITGGTGSGKTSIINLIPRLYDVTKGSVKVDGLDVRDYSIEELRNKIGIVMQKAVLFKGTIRENLLWGKKNASDQELLNALTIAQAKDFVMEKTNQLEENVSQGGRNLSGGQRQRLTIARALVKSPEILILDDSASALDFATDARLRKAIMEMNHSPTVFIISQRAASLMYADKIIVMEEGCIAGMGTHAELLNCCSVYQEIYYSQFRKEEKA